jgi:hypothetical protein
MSPPPALEFNIISIRRLSIEIKKINSLNVCVGVVSIVV